MTYIINGEEVEYLHIENSLNGDVNITFTKKFNIVDAHMGEIMKKLRENGLVNSLVFKFLKYDIIMITFKNIEEVTPIIHLFNIPYGAYEVMEEDCMIVVDTPLL